MNKENYEFEIIKSKIKDDYLILLKLKNQIIGYCAFCIRNNKGWGKLTNDNDLIEPYLKDKEIEYGMKFLFASLFVKENYRGNGLGNQLILQRIERLRSLNIKEFIAETKGKIDYHNEIYKSLDSQGLVYLKSTDSQTYHHIGL